MSYQRGIYQANLDPTTGREQAGERPVLVVSAEPLNERYDVVMVAPITSRKSNQPARLVEVLLPVGTGGLPGETFALFYQVRSVDKSRLGRRYGEITDPTLQEQMLHTFADCFDIE